MSDALDLRSVGGPIGIVLRGGRGGVRTERAVELLAEDVSVPEVSDCLGQDVDQDIEQLDVRLGPPRHVPRCVDRQCLDRLVGVLARPLVCDDDVARDSRSVTHM